MSNDCIDHGQKGNRQGYGKTSRDGNTNVLKHRAVYCDAHGLPLSAIDGLVIRHTCDNPRCINPLHLVKGTHQDNVRDRVQRNRSARGERQGNCSVPDSVVAELRSLYVPRSSEFGARALATKFGLSYETVASILFRNYRR